MQPGGLLSNVLEILGLVLPMWKDPHTPAVSLSPSRTMVVGFTCIYYTQGYSQTVQQSQVCPASCLSGHDILRNLCVFQGGDPLREVCAVQSGCWSQSLAFSQTFPLSPERRTGMQHGKFSLSLSLGLQGGVETGLWVTTPSSLSTLARDFTSSTAAVCVWLSTQLPWPSSQRPVFRGQLWHWRSNHIWPVPPPHCPPATHTVCLHFISKTGFISGSVWLTCPVFLFWSF